MTYCCINGKFISIQEAVIPAGSRAFRYGYGLFETMLVREGNIRLESLHRERLMTGMAALQIDTPLRFWEQGREMIADLLRKNRHENHARVRLQVWPGDGGYFDQPFHTSFCIESFPLEKIVTELNENGLILGIAAGVCKTRDSLSNYKTCSSLPYAIAARQAKTNKWNDGIVLNDAGRLVDTCIANLFYIEKEIIFTPSLSEGPVSGVMRNHLISLLRQHSYEVREEEMHPEKLATADAVFLTNAIRGIRWVKSLDTNEYSQGMVAEVHRILSASH